jgi:hypothetical protein
VRLPTAGSGKKASLEKKALRANPPRRAGAPVASANPSGGARIGPISTPGKA